MSPLLKIGTKCSRGGQLETHSRQNHANVERGQRPECWMPRQFGHIVSGSYTPVLAKHLAESTDAMAPVPCSGQPSAAPSGVGCENPDVLRRSKQ